MRLLAPAIAICLAALGTGCGSPGTILGTDDAGSSDAPTALPAQSCKKIDLVFSVDPSSSMNEELDAMASEVFPAFASALLAVGDGLDDYRVAALDACPSPANFHTRGESASSCGFQSNQAWMTSDSSALSQEFACVGDIYRDSDCSGDNDDERPLRAALASLQPPYSTSANAGFLRDDALLVMVAITDEDECDDPPACSDKSESRTQALYDSLVAIKGDVRKMVLLGIGGGLPDGCAAGSYGQASAAVLLNQVTTRFQAQGRGVWWDLCAGQLEDGLTEAIEVIEQACQDFPEID